VSAGDGVTVTQTVLTWATYYLLIANFLSYIRAKDYENWLAVDGVIKILKNVAVLRPTAYIHESESL